MESGGLNVQNNVVYLRLVDHRYSNLCLDGEEKACVRVCVCGCVHAGIINSTNRGGGERWKRKGEMFSFVVLSTKAELGLGGGSVKHIVESQCI